MRSFLLALGLLVLASCTSMPVGEVTTDSEGNHYKRTQVTTEYEVLCEGSCLQK